MYDDNRNSVGGVPQNSKKNFFQRNKKFVIAVVVLAAVAGLIAIPFIYDSKKTLEVLNNGLSSVNTMIQKTGLSYPTLGMIVIGAFLAAMVIGLAGAIFAGRKKHTIVDPTSCVINENNITLNYNTKDLDFTKAFDEKKKVQLQSLLDANISGTIGAEDAIICNKLVLNFNNVAKDCGIKFAQKIVDLIKIKKDKSVVCKFSDSFIELDNEKNKDLSKIVATTEVTLAPDSPNSNTRIINVTLTQNLEKNPEKLSTSNNIHNGCVKAWNFTLGKISDKIKLAEVTLD
jgi:hypothetical protein